MRLLRTTGIALFAACTALVAGGCSFITGVRGTSKVTVTVSPNIIGLNQNAQAIGTAYDGNTPLSGNSRYAVTYTSRNPNIATVDQARGLITGVAYGTTYIVGENRGERDSAQIIVRPVQAVQLVINGPRTPTFRVGAPNGIGATAFDSASRQVADRPISYASRTTAVLTVSSIGVVQPIAVGTSWIVASIDNGPGNKPATDSVLATVTLTPVVGIRITPSNDNNFVPTIYTGQTQQFSAILTDSLNQTVTRPVTWSIAPNYGGYLSIDSTTGRATGTAPLTDFFGNPTTTTIFATSVVVPGAPQPRQITAAVNVQVLLPADSVRITNTGGTAITSVTVSKGSNVSLVLTALDVQRLQLPGRQFTITTSDPAIASVTNTVSGSSLFVSGNATGTATLTIVTRNLNDGTAQGKPATLTVTVQ